MRDRETTIRIDRATEADLGDIQTIADAAYGKYVAAIGRKPAPMVADFASQISQGCVYVARSKDDAICGYVVFYPRGDSIHLENVAVSPDHQGGGIGRVLVDYVEDVAARDGFNSVDLYTNERMTENLRIYPMLGYVETERREEDGFHRVYYRKVLTT